MSHHEDAPDESSDDQPAPTSDVLLEMLAQMAAKGATFPITLYVKGLVISGTLIGGREYLEHYAASLTHGWDEAQAESIRESFGLNEPAPSLEDAGPSGPVHFINLRGAQLFVPGQPPMPSEGMFWRGRLKEIDGFSYGKFAITP